MERLTKESTPNRGEKGKENIFTRGPKLNCLNLNLQKKKMVNDKKNEEKTIVNK